MKPSMTLAFIREAAESLFVLRNTLRKIARAKTLDEAQAYAKAALAETLQEDDE